MQLRVGYELIYDSPRPTPMTLVLSIHFTRIADIIVPDHLNTMPSLPISAYCDTYGNWCSRLVAPTGWGCVQPMCDFVHRHVTFGNEHARSTTSFRVRTDEVQDL